MPTSTRRRASSVSNTDSSNADEQDGHSAKVRLVPQKSWSMLQELKSLEDAHKTAIVNKEKEIAEKDKKLAEMDLELDELMNCETDRIQSLEEEREQLLRDHLAAELREAGLARRIRNLEAQVASLQDNSQNMPLRRNRTIGTASHSSMRLLRLHLANAIQAVTKSAQMNAQATSKSTQTEVDQLAITASKSTQTETFKSSQTKVHQLVMTVSKSAQTEVQLFDGESTTELSNAPISGMLATTTFESTQTELHPLAVATSKSTQTEVQLAAATFESARTELHPLAAATSKSTQTELQVFNGENSFAHVPPAAGKLGSEQPEHAVDYINGHRWIGKNLKFQVVWKGNDATWESFARIQDCVALDAYLKHHGLENTANLSKKKYCINERIA
ncbi:hypothetical protein BT96DRAFT_1007956 [Gymnopus androsaceus JB14]|uniref:Chromo domain-containing protein n=1 Tax=Gymnopus androsaceus JB14 TaxID=1447944 RepID=A0A6A4GGD8_9AGAR|nr:hypothetical protein BT96DRAFT_1007956 [Gymnopus androsaceus JB14]